jgi:hypothetical protein
VLAVFMKLLNEFQERPEALLQAEQLKGIERVLLPPFAIALNL